MIGLNKKIEYIYFDRKQAWVVKKEGKELNTNCNENELRLLIKKHLANYVIKIFICLFSITKLQAIS